MTDSSRTTHSHRSRHLNPASSAGFSALPHIELMLIVVLSFVTTYPMLLTCIPISHCSDLRFHLARMLSISDGLSQGIFPVRLYQHQAFGFGYPCGICYPDLFFTFPAVLLRLGLSLKASVTLFILFINVLTASLATFSFGRIFSSKRIGYFCTAVWMLSPYRLCDTLLRYAFGESLALAFGPLLVYGFYACLANDDHDHPWLALGIAAAGIVQSHLLSVVLYFVVGAPVCLYLLICGKSHKKLSNLLKAACLAFFLSACFVVPFLDYYPQHDLRVKHSVTYKTTEYALQPAQLFAPFLPFSGKARKLSTHQPLQVNMPLEVGWTLLAILPLVTMQLLDTNGSTHRSARKRLVCALLLTALVTLFATTYFFPWSLSEGTGLLGRAVSALSVIQFPWRLLGQASLLLVLLWGMVLREPQVLSDYMKQIVAFAIVLCVIEGGYATSSFLFNADMLTPEDQASIMAKEDHYVTNGEYLPADLSAEPYAQKNDASPLASSDQLTVLSYEHLDAYTYRCKATNTSSEEQVLTLPLFWHKQYQATRISDEGVSQPCEVFEKEGYVAVSFSPNESAEIEVVFTEPLIWRASEVLTLVSIICVSAFVIVGYVRRKRSSR